MEPMLTMGELAAHFKLTRSTAYRLCKEQQWPHHTFGREIRFSMENVKAIEEITFTKPPEPRRAPRVGTRANRRNQK
jgi:excisionase family DNA binding protein